MRFVRTSNFWNVFCFIGALVSAEMLVSTPLGASVAILALRVIPPIVATLILLRIRANYRRKEQEADKERECRHEYMAVFGVSPEDESAEAREKIKKELDLLQRLFLLTREAMAHCSVDNPGHEALKVHLKERHDRFEEAQALARSCPRIKVSL